MGANNEPGRDDYGLPPADVVVPDDARELDRDVQAYHREQRQQRRRTRRTRLVHASQRFGVVAPLIVIIVLIVGIATSLLVALGPNTAQQHTPRGHLATSPTASPGHVGGLLPDTTLRIVDTSATRSVRMLRPAVLLIVPPGCQCRRTINGLTRQIHTNEVPVYLVTSKRPTTQLRELANTDGNGVVIVARDPQGKLARTYETSELTAVLVHEDGIVGGVLRDLSPNTNLRKRLSPLLGPGQPAAVRRP